MISSHKIPFWKFESTGNDFIMIDNRHGAITLVSNEIEKLCDRRFGVGGDGLILIASHADLDFRMRYFNSDGHEASFCGNGGRAICGLASMLGIPGTHYTFEAFDGIHQADIQFISASNWHVSLQMHDVLVDNPDLIQTGSPHHIKYIQNLDDFDVSHHGKAIRYSPMFNPDGCNVNFVEMHDGVLFVRTYERGVEAETLSCGTGVTASAIFHHLHKPDDNYTIPISTRGGSLEVHFCKRGNYFTDIRLIGETRLVFAGDYYL